MTGPSSTPRGERVGTLGANWEARLVHTETVIDDDPENTSGPDMNRPYTPPPNRATRRALKRAARRKK